MTERATPRPGGPRRLLAPALVLALVGVLAWIPRTFTRLTTPVEPGSERWFTVDPDSHYHMRRLERLLVEGAPVAERDPYLNFPHGAAIPWPPYYTWVLGALVAPGAPSVSDSDSDSDGSAALHEHVERAVASLPRWFAVGTALVLALAARRLAGDRAALAAGGIYALLHASIQGSTIGKGDHHPWVSLLAAGSLALFARALDERGERDGPTPAHATALGAGAGALAGVMLGSWVAGLVQVMLIEALLGGLLVVHARRPIRALVPFGLAFHLAALAAVAPAILSSPWKDADPWMVVNLSWYHALHLAFGAAVFAVPLLAPHAARFLRAWPWIVLAVLVVGGGGLAWAEVGPGRGLREGFSWAGGTNPFMAYVRESEPLLGGTSGGLDVLTQFLGYGVLLLPLAWGVAAWRALVGGQRALLPWVVALPPLALQALLQRRHAEALGVPMAVILGWAIGSLRAPRAAAGARRWVAAAAWGSTLAAVLVLQRPAVAETWRGLRAGGLDYEAVPSLAAQNRAYREMYRWLDGGGAGPAAQSVLASWQHGHSIEWVARRPSVATNFGLYLGEDSYLDPWRFQLALDPREAEAILERRVARHTLVTDALPKSLYVMLRATDPDRPERFLDGVPGPQTVAEPAFFRTVGAQLLQDGRALDGEGRPSGPSLDFLRLVWVSPTRVGRLHLYPPEHGARPTAWIWERVAGARLEVTGAPGATLRAELEVEFARAGHALRWIGEAIVGADGRATLRIPYATEDDNGEGRVRGVARWTLGERAGRLRIEERDVLEGRTLRTPGADAR